VKGWGCNVHTVLHHLPLGTEEDKENVSQGSWCPSRVPSEERSHVLPTAQDLLHTETHHISLNNTFTEQFKHKRQQLREI
jgi:hypothetical protein